MRPIISVALLTGAAISVSGARALADNPAPATSNDDIRAMVAEMLSDAQTRSSLLQAGASAGHDGHFFLASPDGNFRLNISGGIQFRYNLAFTDQGPNSAGQPIDDFASGFQNRRFRLKFDGHIYDPNLYYGFQGEFARGGANGGAFILLDGYAGYKFDNGLNFKWGQFKLPFSREFLMSAWKQLGVERSFTNNFFNANRAKAIQVSYASDNWRASGAFSNGAASLNTDFNASPADWALTGRVEMLVAGSWEQFSDYTSAPGSEDALMIGLAAHYERSPDTPTTAIQDRIMWTADVSWESDGWGLAGAFYGNHQTNGAISGASVDEYGGFVQGSLYVTDDLEAFSRYSIIIPDSSVPQDKAFNTISFGANYYIHGHAAKFTTDVQIFLDDVNGTDTITGGSTGVGFIDNGAQSGEYLVRLQFQLLF